MLDQARAMEVAIGNVLPSTTHRWCKWHVLRKAKESLGYHFSKKGEFRTEFYRIVHDMLTVAEFEDAWPMLLAKYKLQNNPFLTQIYEERSFLDTVGKLQKNHTGGALPHGGA